MLPLVQPECSASELTCLLCTPNYPAWAWAPLTTILSFCSSWPASYRQTGYVQCLPQLWTLMPNKHEVPRCRPLSTPPLFEAGYSLFKAQLTPLLHKRCQAGPVICQGTAFPFYGKGGREGAHSVLSQKTLTFPTILKILGQAGGGLEGTPIWAAAPGRTQMCHLTLIRTSK